MSRPRPSRTAVRIAAGLLYLASDERLAPLLPDGAAECTRTLLGASGTVAPWRLALAEKPWLQRLARRLARRATAGRVVHIGLRKRFFESETREAIVNGAEQVLVIGPGFDTLGPRLARERADLLFVEIDRPHTTGARRRGVEALGGPWSNLYVLGAELAEVNLPAVLGAAFGWRPDARTVVIAEGVLMYLDEASVSNLLVAIREVTGRCSRLLFSYLGTDRMGRPDVGQRPGLVRVALHLMGEPLCWGIAPEDLDPFLVRHGYRLEASTERYDLRQRFLVPAALGDEVVSNTELMAVAEVSATSGSLPA